MKLNVAFTVLLFGMSMGMTTPAFAGAHARTTATAHMRPQLFHDRTPHVHERTVQQRQR